MRRIMPSQVVKTIESLFPHAGSTTRNATIGAGQNIGLRGVADIADAVPDELISVSAEEYADFVLAMSAIRDVIEQWKANGNRGGLSSIKGRDAITIIWDVMKACPDDHPVSLSTEFAFIPDDATRETIARDVEAARRALTNIEWKAATVLAGSAIEALLHWKLGLLTPTVRAAAISTAVTAGTLSKSPPNSLDEWVLYQYVLLAGELKILKSDTVTAVLLAKDYRNLIHPGAAVRRSQQCDRGTAHSAIGALERTITDLQ